MPIRQYWFGLGPIAPHRTSFLDPNPLIDNPRMTLLSSIFFLQGARDFQIQYDKWYKIQYIVPPREGVKINDMKS